MESKGKQSAAKSAIKSGVTNDKFEKVLGLGSVKEKSVEQIAKVHSPRSRGKAPGSVRV
jgi:hypothetical protein